uniref:Uncharacterized protein n=1 Tax=Oryza meridionalis TaxID=40149 RepID=A0A0E0E868_9ORYZ
MNNSVMDLGPYNIIINYRSIYYYYDDDYYVENEPIVKEKFEKFEWDFDSDNVLEPGSRRKDCYVYFLAFHPYKDTVFLGDKFDRVLAYNWSSSKLQDLARFSQIFTHHATYMHYDKLPSRTVLRLFIDSETLMMMEGPSQTVFQTFTDLMTPPMVMMKDLHKLFFGPSPINDDASFNGS